MMEQHYNSIVQYSAALLSAKIGCVAGIHVAHQQLWMLDAWHRVFVSGRRASCILISAQVPCRRGPAARWAQPLAEAVPECTGMVLVNTKMTFACKLISCVVAVNQELCFSVLALPNISFLQYIVGGK